MFPARIQSLETELLSHRQEAESMHSTLDEMSATSRKSRSHKEHERQELEERVLRLTGELDRAKTEVCGCQRMFHMRDMHTGYTAQVTP